MHFYSKYIEKSESSILWDVIVIIVVLSRIARLWMSLETLLRGYYNLLSRILAATYVKLGDDAHIIGNSSISRQIGKKWKE
jgi:hypothetical protein